MEALREVKVRYLVQFDNQWNLLRIVHESNIAPEYLDTPEGVWMLDGGNFGQDDFMGIGITVDIDTVSELGYDSSEVFVSYDLVLVRAEKVFGRWLLGFQAAAEDALDDAFEQLNEKPEIY